MKDDQHDKDDDDATRQPGSDDAQIKDLAPTSEETDDVRGGWISKYPA